MELILFRKIVIKPIDASNIDSTILTKLKAAVENKCVSEGYIKKIEQIINRTRGSVDLNDLSGNIIFNVSYKAEVITINTNDIIIGATVALITPAGIFLTKDDYIKIFIPKENLTDTYNINDKIHILVLKANWGLQQNKINVIGQENIYYTPNENERLLVFPPTISQKFDLNIETTELREEIKTTCIYGFNPKMNELKDMIDNINSDVWRYFRSLLNPFELVCPPKSYSTYKLYSESIPSRAYFKIWEILTMHLNDLKGNNILNLCESPGGFIKALIDFIPDKKLQFNLVSLDNDIKVSNDLINNYKSIIKVSYMDITKYESLEKLIKEYSKNKANIITADGGIKLPDGEFNEELELGYLKFAEIVIALSCQAPHGTFIIKLFDSCSQLMVDLIYIIYQCYKEVIIYKPETSRPASSERYLIAVDFQGIEVDILKKLQDVLKGSNKRYIMRILSKIMDKTFINVIRTINTRINTCQIKKIKEMIEMIGFYNNTIPPKNYINKLQLEQQKFANEWIINYKFKGKLAIKK